MNKVYIGVDRAGIVVPRENIKTTGLSLKPDVYGAISVHPEGGDPKEMCFHFELIIKEKLDCIETDQSIPFALDWDFTDLAISLASRTRPKSLQKHFPTSVDLGTFLVADENRMTDLRSELLREWFAQFLGANFSFGVEVKSNDDYDEDDPDSSKYCAFVTLTDPATGSEKTFEAPVNPLLNLQHSHIIYSDG